MKALFIYEGTVGEFPLAMTALEALADANKQLKIELVCEQKLVDTAKRAWFISSVWPGSGPEDTSSYELLLDLEVNKEDCAKYEKQWKADRKAQIDEKMAELSEATKIPLKDLAYPSDYDSLKNEGQTWHAIQGYCHTIAEASSLNVNLRSVAPMQLTVPGSKEKTNKYLHAHRETIKSGVPFVVVHNNTLLKEKGIDVPLPVGWALIEVDDDTEPWLVFGLINHNLCKGAIGSPSLATYSAWARNLKTIVDVFDTSKDAAWLSTRTENSYGIVLDSIASPEVAEKVIAKAWLLSYDEVVA